MCRTRNVAVALTALLFGSAASAQQERAPTDNELHTAYCIPVVKWGIEADQQLLSQEQHAGVDTTASQQDLNALQTVMKRLQAYLLPRWMSLDTLAIVGAMNRGKADMKELETAGDRCFRQCGSTLDSASTTPAQAACVSTCANNDPLIARTRACRNPTWLPF